MEVLNALARLDPEDDELWTANGVPRVEAVAAIVGREITRQEITDASHDFSRDVARTMAAADPDDDGDAMPNPDEELPLAASGVALEPVPPAAEQTNPHETEATAHLPDNPATAAEIKAAELNDEANAKIEEAKAIEREVDRLVGRKAQLLREADVLITERERVLPSPTDAQARRLYLDRQHEIRIERHLRRQTILANLDGADIAKGAPIDEAMRRKRNRGTKRPQRPMAQQLRE